MKQVINEEPKPITTIKEHNSNLIYAFENDAIYKLQEITDIENSYGFFQLDHSNANKCSRLYHTAQEAIEAEINNNEVVYEFEDMEEFIRWCVEIYEIEIIKEE